MKENNKWSDEWSTMSVKRTTKNRLKTLGNFDENWDDLFLCYPYEVGI